VSGTLSPGMAGESEVERELKLAIPDRETLERIADAVGAAPPVAQTNIFYDTAAGALRDSGHGLRLRLQPPIAEVTFKGPNTGDGGAAVRMELGGAVDWAIALQIADGGGRIESLPGRALDEARRIAGGAPIAERMRFRNDRRIAYVDINGERCELVCDATTFPDDSIEYEMEIETPDDATLRAARGWAEQLFGRLAIAVVDQTAGKAARAARKAGLR